MSANEMSSSTPATASATKSSSPVKITADGKGSSNVTDKTTNIKAQMVSVSNLKECGQRLKAGDLVAFPTETVYGLGANALDVNAITKIFLAKERPLTDPLISHITNPQAAYDLWQHGPNITIEEDEDVERIIKEMKDTNSHLEGRALRAICDRFWPGPLTVVAKAKDHVPSLLMANTGYVACRSPKHSTARALIDAAGIPIAAPSANKFGHVSPTRSQHVWDDLKYEDVWIMQEDNNKNDSSGTDDIGHYIFDEGTCEVGVESSVVKIEMIPVPSSSSAAADTIPSHKRGKVTLLRQGAVSVEDIERCLIDAGLSSYFDVLKLTKKADNESVAQIAPGQTIRHYSPNIPSFILKSSACPSYGGTRKDNDEPNLSVEELDVLKKCILIDFGGRLKYWKDCAMAYKDLSTAGDSAIATKNVFETLRWAEQVRDATRIIFPEITISGRNKCGGNKKNQSENNASINVQDDYCDRSSSIADALTLALKDRLTRAASGVVIDSLTFDI